MMTPPTVSVATTMTTIGAMLLQSSMSDPGGKKMRSDAARAASCAPYGWGRGAVSASRSA